MQIIACAKQALLR